MEKLVGHIEIPVIDLPKDYKSLPYESMRRTLSVMENCKGEGSKEQLKVILSQLFYSVLNNTP